ncbi:uncharacterized protein L199_004154 [Kwoniella botswanensis]|uniref:uncharacterized protein n=1 Tax=Kwoniella botswanensis TaxID=1268659 RepID=UPI00315DF687
MADKETTNMTSTPSKVNITSSDGNPPSVGDDWKMDDIFKENTSGSLLIGGYRFKDDTLMYDTQTQRTVFFQKDHGWDAFSGLWNKGTEYNPNNLRLIKKRRKYGFFRSIPDEMLDSDDEMPGTFPGTHEQYKSNV